MNPKLHHSMKPYALNKSEIMIVISELSKVEPY